MSTGPTLITSVQRAFRLWEEVSAHETGEAPGLQVLPFGDGDQLLLSTDGVTEARDADREFCPLAEGFARHPYDDPTRTVAALYEELLTHVGGRLHDDAALLLLRKPAVASAAPEPKAGEAGPAAPAAEPGSGGPDGVGERRHAA